MSELTLVLAGALLLALGLVAWLLVGNRRELQGLQQRGMPAEGMAEMLQRQIEGVRQDGRSGQDGLKQEVGELSARVREEVGALRLAVAGELKGVTAEVTRQLQEGMRLVQDSQSTMGERLDHAAKVVGEVQGSLGKLGEATQRVEEVGREIHGLEQVLKSPKIRGGLGETLLEQLLAQMLPREHYELQYNFATGDRVDAVVRIGDRLVPVDAKFPLENFRRLIDETDEEKRRQFRRAFVRDVKARVDEIAKRYILPDEGTFDFALMYVPAENVYYEIVVKSDDGAEEEAVAEYAMGRRVIPVSPNSFYAYLRVIVLGLKGLRIERDAQEIQARLGRLRGDLDRFRETFEVVGKHLTNAKNKYDESATALGRVEAKLEGVEKQGDQAVLPGPGP